MKTPFNKVKIRTHFNSIESSGFIFTMPSKTEASHDVTIRDLYNRALRGQAQLAPLNPSAIYDEDFPQHHFDRMNFADKWQYSKDLNDRRKTAMENEKLTLDEITSIEAQAEYNSKIDAAVAEKIKGDKTNSDSLLI